MEDRRKVTMDALERLVDNTGNYRTYRDMRTSCIEECGHCVPHLALYTRDLTFIEEGNPSFWYESKDLINVGKFRLIARTVLEVNTMKQLGYREIIEPDDSIRKLILSTPRITSSEEQYQQSLLCEARKPIVRDAISQLRAPKKRERRSLQGRILPVSTRRSESVRMDVLPQFNSEPAILSTPGSSGGGSRSNTICN